MNDELKHYQSNIHTFISSISVFLNAYFKMPIKSQNLWESQVFFVIKIRNSPFNSKADIIDQHPFS